MKEKLKQKRKEKAEGEDISSDIAHFIVCLQCQVYLEVLQIFLFCIIPKFSEYWQSVIWWGFLLFLLTGTRPPYLIIYLQSSKIWHHYSLRTSKSFQGSKLCCCCQPQMQLKGYQDWQNHDIALAIGEGKEVRWKLLFFLGSVHWN